MFIALITGITGQDGSYLAEFLLEKGYIIYGVIRRASDFNTKRIEHLFGNQNLKLKYGDMTDSINLCGILQEIKNSHTEMERLEVYNLAAMSHVKVSFEVPEYTVQTDGVGTLRLLEAIRICGLSGKTRFYQASTSELYGKVQEVPQSETTQFYPRSPYGCAKLYAYWITKNYRESYGLFACNGILFNHCSPRRGPTFVTRKITRALGAIMRGEQEELVLGNLDAKRDWGHAKDFVEAQWLIMQADEPRDYVVATNEYHSVREFVERSFALKGINIKWRGSGLDEVGYDGDRIYIRVSEKYFRPAEVEELLGDSSKIRRELGWNPRYSFEELIEEMVEHDS